MYCFRHSGVMWAVKCSANFILMNNFPLFSFKYFVGKYLVSCVLTPKHFPRLHSTSVQVGLIDSKFLFKKKSEFYFLSEGKYSNQKNIMQRGNSFIVHLEVNHIESWLWFLQRSDNKYSCHMITIAF